MKYHFPSRYLLLACTLLLMAISLVLLPSSGWSSETGLAIKDPPEPAIMLVTERRRNNLNHIFTFDEKPLGHRVPVILVPGRAEEYQQNAWWHKLRNRTYRDVAFDSTYKLYVYIYNSEQDLKLQADGLSSEIKQHFGYLPAKRQVVLISYSLGGVIAREAMADPEIFRRIHTVFAIAVPFHGSPIFDTRWFSQYLQTPTHSPIRRWWDRVIYRAYLFGKTNLTRGLKWDNFDNSRPQFDAIDIQGDQVNSPLLPYTEEVGVDAIKKKLWIYGCYLENEYIQTTTNSGLQRLIETSKALPKAFVSSILPFYGFSVHQIFNYTNLQLANLSASTPSAPKGKNTHLYRYNDGAIPLASMLYLPSRSRPYNDDLAGLVKAIDVPAVRIFTNLDHLDIGEYNRFPAKITALDELHPAEGKRTPNDWLLYDLQHLAPMLSDRP